MSGLVGVRVARQERTGEQEGEWGRAGGMRVQDKNTSLYTFSASNTHLQVRTVQTLDASY